MLETIEVCFHCGRQRARRSSAAVMGLQHCKTSTASGFFSRVCIADQVGERPADRTGGQDRSPAALFHFLTGNTVFVNLSIDASKGFESRAKTAELSEFATGSSLVAELLKGLSQAIMGNLVRRVQ